LALLAGAARGAGRVHRLRVARVDREVAADVAQHAAIDPVALQLIERRHCELAAERALQVGELHHRQGRVVLAERVAFEVFHTCALRRLSRLRQALEQLTDRAQFLEDLLVLLLDRGLLRRLGLGRRRLGQDRRAQQAHHCQHPGQDCEAALETLHAHHFRGTQPSRVPLRRWTLDINAYRLMDMESAALFRLLGDDARLRILRLLDAERLNVSELTSILGIAQSGVSRHLGLLKDAGLVEERKDAGFTYFRLAPALQTGQNGFGPVWPLLRAQFDAAAGSARGRADDARLEEVRRVRKENFDEHGADAGHRQIVPGRSWAAWARALGHLLPPLVVADLGCGAGYLAVEASRFAKRVIAVDRSEAALARARDMAKRFVQRTGDAAKAGRERLASIEWKRGELEDLPLKDASVDVALLSQ